jgi:hypothetical protein
MTSYTLSPVWGAGAQLFDNSGNVLTGGKIETYEAGTTTLAVTYTNPIGSIFNSNPIVADASGRLSNEIWLSVGTAYKFVLKDANNVLIATYDNIPSSPQPPITNDASSISYEQGYTVTAGAFTVGATYLITSVGSTNFVGIGAAANVTGILFTATGVGSGTGTAQYSRTVQAKLQESVSVKDFGAIGDGVTDDRVAIQAALDASSAVYFPEGVYAISDQIVLNSSQKLHGDGYASVLLSTGISKNIIYGNNVTNVEIASLFLQGNATENNTACIRLFYSTYINIHDCYFDGHGNTSGNASNIGGDFCSYVIVDRNIFLGNSGGSQTGADVAFVYYDKQCVVTNNLSYSNHDSMVSLAGVSVSTEETTHHVVASNIGIRRDSNTSRSGIVASYGKAAYATITGNIMYNWIWNGVYIQAGISNTAESGGATVQGNIIRYCGGGDPSLSSGVYLSGNSGVTCTSNLIEYTSYNSSGVYRGNANQSIIIQNAASNISIVGNIIRKGKGNGIFFSALNGSEQRDIVVSQNVFEDNEAGGIFLAPSNTGNIKNVIISENIIKQEVFDANGIQIVPSDGAVAPENLQIIDNLINGVSGSTKSGIRTTVATPNAWLIRGNLIDTFDKGFECTTFPGDQLYGTACILDGNTIKNCTTGYFIGTTGGNQNGYVFNPTYINVTNKHASAFYNDAVNLGNGNVNIRRAAAPNGGTWRAGDQVTYLAPVASGFIGVVCVTAGSPGTWKTYGAITA